MAEVDADALYDELPAVAPTVLPYMDAVWRAARRASAGPASASCSRARRARCSTSTTAPIPSSPRPTRWPGRPRPARGSARAPSATCSASPRPTRRASARARSRPSCSTRSASLIGERGREFGTVTGRTRRCGWFDAVLVRQTVRTSGIDGIALTKLDILDGFEEIKVCVGYRLDGETIDHLPASQAAQARGRAGLRGRSRAGRRRPRGARSWADCRRRRSNMCAASRN